jgi:hypothetical protein
VQTVLVHLDDVKYSLLQSLQFFWQFCAVSHSSSLQTSHYIGVNVKCGQEFCPCQFTRFAVLLRHFQKCHSHLLQAEDEAACASMENESVHFTSFVAHACEEGLSNSKAWKHALTVQVLERVHV